MGHAGEPFFVDRLVTTPLGDLPERFALVVSVGEEARTSLAAQRPPARKDRVCAFVIVKVRFWIRFFGAA